MSAKKTIQELTAKQRARLPEWAKKWVELGLSTEPADRARAEAAVRRAYEVAGREPPTYILWMSNPRDSVLAWALILSWVAEAVTQKRISPPIDGAQVSDQVLAQVRAQVSDQVLAQVRAQVRDQVSAQVRAQVSDQVLAQVSAQVSDQVRDQVRDQVSDQVRDQVRDQVSDQVRAWISYRWWWTAWGNQEWWLSWMDYFGQVINLDIEKVKPQIDLAQSAHWWWPMAGVAIMCERPIQINRDERGRLHSETGPAVEYGGWGVYAIHGVRLSEHIILRPETITVDEILAERNAEIRRVMIERYGAGRFLIDAGAKEISRDKYGVLYRKEFSDDEPLVMVKVKDPSTIREYFLRVPPDIKSAHAAVAWTFDLEPAEYAPLVES